MLLRCSETGKECLVHIVFTCTNCTWSGKKDYGYFSICVGACAGAAQEHAKPQWDGQTKLDWWTFEASNLWLTRFKWTYSIAHPLLFHAPTCQSMSLLEPVWILYSYIIRLTHTDVWESMRKAFQLHAVYKEPYFVLQVTWESVSVLHENPY